MKKNNMIFAEELMTYIYHPSRVLYYMDTYSYDILDDSYSKFFLNEI